MKGERDVFQRSDLPEKELLGLNENFFKAQKKKIRFYLQ